MNQLPQHSYFGQYYFNPQWVQATDSGSPSVVYNNVVNFSVGPDGTHYFHQTYSGQFVAPSASTVDMKMVRQLSAQYSIFYRSKILDGVLSVFL